MTDGQGGRRWTYKIKSPRKGAWQDSLVWLLHLAGGSDMPSVGRDLSLKVVPQQSWFSLSTWKLLMQNDVCYTLGCCFLTSLFQGSAWSSVWSLINSLHGLWTSPPKSCLCVLSCQVSSSVVSRTPHKVAWPQTLLAHSQRSPTLQLASFGPWDERELFLPYLYSFPAAFGQQWIKGQHLMHHRDWGQIFFEKGNSEEIWTGVKSWDQRNVQWLLWCLEHLVETGQKQILLSG